MVRDAYIPGRGDIVWIQFNPQAGYEQAGHRPALVISPESYNAKVGLALMCPITSQVKDYPFEVLLSGVEISGVVLADQIKSLDWRVRRAEFVCKASTEVITEVIAKIQVLVS